MIFRKHLYILLNLFLEKRYVIKLTNKYWTKIKRYEGQLSWKQKTLDGK